MNTIGVWILDTRGLEVAAADDLSSSSRERWSGFRSARRRAEFAFGRRLLATAIAAETGHAAEASAIVEGATGPVWSAEPGLALALAHSRGVIAARAGRGRCGIDIEYRDPQRNCAALARFAFPAPDADWVCADRDAVAERFHRLWTLREAAYKAGLSDSVHDPEPLVRAGRLDPPYAAWTKLLGEYQLTVVTAAPIRVALYGAVCMQGRVLRGCGPLEPEDRRSHSELLPTPTAPRP